MEVRLGSQGAPDRPGNEDFAFAAGGLVGVLDGVTRPDGVQDGCLHSPTWYVRRLAAQLVGIHSAEPELALTQLLALAIARVRGEHGVDCDLTHPGTPAATVCLVKDAGGHLEYLVLCDCPLVLDRGDQVDVIVDDRFDRTISRVREVALVPGNVGTADHAARLAWAAVEKQRYTNKPDGYWVAGADPRAAHEAITGTAPLRGSERVRRAALLTDGAAAAVDQFGLLDWRGLLDLLTDAGPTELIRRIRAAELDDRDGHARPRYKRHDDATVALCLFDREHS
jgi:hypothetical protein